jgi:hypothetical protein
MNLAANQRNLEKLTAIPRSQGAVTGITFRELEMNNAEVVMLVNSSVLHTSTSPSLLLRITGFDLPTTTPAAVGGTVRLTTE